MPYIQPSRADVHVDRPLTNISVAYMQSAGNFIADRVFPVIPVGKQSDKYFTYDRGMFNRDEMQLRAPGAESAGATYSLSTASYLADTWALHKDIADQVRANADSPLQLDREATEFLTIKALIRKEKNWNDSYFSTGIWGTDVTGVAAAPGAGQFLQWNDAASSPIEDVRKGARVMHKSTGFRPNKLVLGRPVYDALLDHPDVIGRIDRGQTAGTAVVMRQNLAALFEMDEILVMDAILNTAVEGATNAHDFVGGRNALLCYSNPSPGLMVPSAGYTFSWTGLLGAGALGTRIKRMRMEHLESDRLEIEMSFDQRKVAADLGYFFSSAVVSTF
jgi:hypothetical protein